MFETDPSIGLQATAFRNKQVADANHASYVAWKNHALKLEARIAELEDALAVKSAAAEGHAAVVEAFKAQHANSPLLVQEGVLKNGNPRRKSTSIWIAAFDAAARKLGITNPEAHRIS